MTNRNKTKLAYGVFLTMLFIGFLGYSGAPWMGLIVAGSLGAFFTAVFHVCAEADGSMTANEKSEQPRD